MKYVLHIDIRYVRMRCVKLTSAKSVAVGTSWCRCWYRRSGTVWFFRGEMWVVSGSTVGAVGVCQSAAEEMYTETPPHPRATHPEPGPSDPHPGRGRAALFGYHFSHSLKSRRVFRFCLFVFFFIPKVA